jgi:hypothetical protein
MFRQTIWFDFSVKLLRDGGIGMAVADKGAKIRGMRIGFRRFCQFFPAIERPGDIGPISS